MPTIYVIAGPNGIGKTTSSYNIVPHNTPVINSDEIAKEARSAGIIVNTQEFSNREASKLINDQTEQQNSFAIETNLCDVDTWKFLIGLQKTGYTLHVLFVSTDDLNVLNKRIEERVHLGDHYVHPDVVADRYWKGIQLLRHYYNQPDVLQLFDNAEKITLMAEFHLGKKVFQSEKLPDWIEQHIIPQLQPQEQTTRVADLKNLDEVRKAYQQLKDTAKNKPQESEKVNRKQRRPRL